MAQRVATTALPYTEYPVAEGDFDRTRGTINMIVIHTEAGFKAGAEARFNDPQSHVSAHYGVNYDGSLDHFLEEYWTAYHAGNYDVNQRSIGIEHEDQGRYNDPRPDILYENSSKLVADICQFYSIPCDRNHIKKHSEVSQLGTACPDALDIDRIIRGALQIINGQSQPVAPVPQPVHSVLPPNYPQIIHDATQWDAEVKDMGLADDPSTVDYDAVKRVVAGYKARITDLTNQVGTLGSEDTNKDEQITRLKKQIDDTTAMYRAQIDTLSKTATTIAEVHATYDARITQLQAQIDQLAKDKGALVNQLAVCQAQLTNATKTQKVIQAVGDGFWVTIAKLLRFKKAE